MKLLEKSKVIAYIFYFIALLFCLYTIFSCVTTIQYLMTVVSSGMYAAVTFSDMLSAFVGQVGPYIVYTFVLFFCGYAIQLISGEVIPEGQQVESPVVKETAETVVTESTPEATVTVESNDENLDNEEAEIKIRKLENGLAEALDQVATNNEVEELELQNEESKEE